MICLHKTFIGLSRIALVNLQGDNSDFSSMMYGTLMQRERSISNAIQCPPGSYHNTINPFLQFYGWSKRSDAKDSGRTHAKSPQKNYFPYQHSRGVRRQHATADARNHVPERLSARNKSDIKTSVQGLGGLHSCVASADDDDLRRLHCSFFCRFGCTARQSSTECERREDNLLHCCCNIQHVKS